MLDDAALRQGFEQLAQQQPLKALESFNRALLHTSDDAAVWNGKATALSRMGEFQQAVVACDQALSRSPCLLGALHTKLVALSELHRYTEALAVAETVLSCHPDLALAWQTKGVLLFKLRQLTEVHEAFDHALALDSHLVSSWIDKGHVLLRLDCPKEAVAAFDRALELQPQDERALQGKAQAHAAQRRDALGKVMKTSLQVLFEAWAAGLWPGQ